MQIKYFIEGQFSELLEVDALPRRGQDVRLTPNGESFEVAAVLQITENDQPQPFMTVFLKPSKETALARTAQRVQEDRARAVDRVREDFALGGSGKRRAPRPAPRDITSEDVKRHLSSDAPATTSSSARDDRRVLTAEEIKRCYAL